MRRLAPLGLVVTTVLVLGLAVLPAQAEVPDDRPVPTARAATVAVRDAAPYVHAFEQSTGGVLHVDTEHRDRDGFWFAARDMASPRGFSWWRQPFLVTCRDGYRVGFNPWMGTYQCLADLEAVDALQGTDLATATRICRDERGIPYAVGRGWDPSAPETLVCEAGFLHPTGLDWQPAAPVASTCAPWEPQGTTPEGRPECERTTYPWATSADPLPWVPAPDVCTGLPAGANTFAVDWDWTRAPYTDANPGCGGADPAPNCTAEHSDHPACGGPSAFPSFTGYDYDEDYVDPTDPGTTFYTASAFGSATSGEGSSSGTGSATDSARAERGTVTETATRTYAGKPFVGSGTAPLFHTATVTVERTAEVAWEETTSTVVAQCTVTTSQADAEACAAEKAARNAQEKADAQAAKTARKRAEDLAREQARPAAAEAARAASLSEPVTATERAEASREATKLAGKDAAGLVEWYRLTHELTPRSARFQVRGSDDKAYVAGQGLLLYGSFGVRGVRKVVVESNLNRPGDSWQELRGDGYQGRTLPNGFFQLPIEAPSMFDISYRVRSGNLTSPPVLFNAKTQDLDLWVEGSTDYARPVQPVVLETFTIVADTTPDLYKRPTSDGLPVLVGRPVTLLRRSGPSSWEKVAAGRVGRDGLVTFSGLVEKRPGDVVYRVRQEEWREEGSDVGWTWSWPLSIHVRDLLEPVSYPPEGSTVPGKQVGGRSPEAAHDNAASTYGWGAARWDYAWTRGESLDAPPTIGTDTSGRWTEVGTGLGRVVRMNGGLLVSSGKLVRDGRGDLGTTSALLRGAAASTGRWEAPLTLTAAEKNDADYDAVLELVPADGSEGCAPVVTIARWTGLGKDMTIGVDRGADRWRRVVRTEGPAYTIPIVAVEVARDHLTWFVDGQPVGTVRDPRATPGVPMTLRMSLEGDEREHDNTSLFSDWQRSFDIGPGRQVTDAPQLDRTARPGC